MEHVRSLVGLILVGGAGTRLWPLSTEEKPKQFLRLFEDRSLIEMTVERLRDAGVGEFVISTGERLVPGVLQELQRIGVVPAAVISEPVRRDSAPAVAAGVAFAKQRWGAETTVVVAPSDHLIRNLSEFRTTLELAAASSKSGNLLTIGVQPRFPSTGYGYIEQGEPLDGYPGAFSVRRFHEKPDLPHAERYISAGVFYWNSGIFVFRAGDFAREAAEHMPEVWERVGVAIRQAVHKDGVLSLDVQEFEAIPRISLDYALIENTHRITMVRASFDWSDIGDWDALHAALPQDSEGNVVLGDARAVDCRTSLVLSDHGAPLVVSGICDMVVVATRSGSLVFPRAQAADLKRLMS